MRLNPAEALDDRKNAIRVLIVLGVAIVFFFYRPLPAYQPILCRTERGGDGPGLGASGHEENLAHIEWSVLIFFAALFIMVGGLGSSRRAGGACPPARRRWQSIPPVLFGVIIIWVVAGLSAVVDNIPITIAMIPVIQGLGAAGMDIGPLWWALAFGAGFGGNGTIIGSTANIVVATLSEKTRTPITAKLWNKRGLPVMLVTCAVATILYILAYPLYLR